MQNFGDWTTPGSRQVGDEAEADARAGAAALHFLRKLSPEFEALGDGPLTEVLPRLRTRAYRRRERLFLAGDRADKVFLVTRGRFKSFVTTPDGRDLILHVAGPGEMLGEVAPFEQAYGTSAEAISEASAIVFPAEAFAALCATSATFSMAISRLLSRRLIHAQQQATSLVSQSVSARLAGLLRAQGQPSADGRTLSMPLTHLEMAQRIGSSRETVTAMLSRFQKMGMLEIRKRQVTIRDRQAFEACIEGRLPVSTRHPVVSLSRESA